MKKMMIIALLVMTSAAVLSACQQSFLAISHIGQQTAIRYNPDSGAYEKISVPHNFLLRWYEAVPVQYTDDPRRYCGQCHVPNDLAVLASYKRRFGGRDQSLETARVARDLVNSVRNYSPSGHYLKVKPPHPMPFI